VLLYPETPEDAGAGPGWNGSGPGGRALVVLDATWRKSRKMLHLNPFLGQLPRLSLEDMSPSRYRDPQGPQARPAVHAGGGLRGVGSQLEGDAGRYRPLLQAFEGFVSQQLGYSGRVLLRP
jgi:DTW domain-containing protein YfiP